MSFPDSFLADLRARLTVSALVGQRIALTKKGHEFEALCPFHSENTPSFTINDEKGFYHCFGCGANGDIIDFEQKNTGVDFPTAVRALAAMAGLDPDQAAKPNGKTPPKRAAAKPFTAILPVPKSAPDAPIDHFKLGAPVGRWAYRDAQGALLGWICRFDKLEGGKEILPLVYGSLDGAPAAWRWHSWTRPRPLYGLDRLANKSTAPVVLVEGEKSADAAGRLLPGYAAVTWPGGANAVQHADFKPLHGRTVVLWPDNDTPGREAMAAIADLIGPHCPTVKVLDVSDAPSDGWDIADAEAEGWDTARTVAWARERARVWAPAITELTPVEPPEPPPPATLPDEPQPLRPAELDSAVVQLKEAERADRIAKAKARKSDREAKREAAGHNTEWHGTLLTDDRGNFLPLLANAITALEQAPEFDDVLAFDEFAMRSHLLGETPWGTKAGAWSDTDDIALANWLQHKGVKVSPDTAAQAVQHVAHQNPHHPVREYLNGLEWDQQPRLETWLSYYLGTPDSPYARAVGQRWLISGVARILKPGCRADHCLILEGLQGKLKSTALSVLADPWFTDETAEIGTKDAAMQVAGVWIIEIAELDALSRVEITKAKAFLARKVDRFRPPFGRRVIERPRECIFAGTTNQSEYLRDETGGRRFWPAMTTTIDLDGLASDRGQLWAEAVHMFRAGSPWWIEDADVRTLAENEQEARYVGDSWEAQIRPIVQGLPQTSVLEVYDAMNIPTMHRDQRSDNRVAKALRRLGFIRFQHNWAGQRTWRYRRILDDAELFDGSTEGQP